MTFEIIAQIILFGIALAMDAFAVSITDGLIYSDINKKRIFFIAGTFGIMQAFMPAIGYFAVEIISLIVGNSGSNDIITTISIFWFIIYTDFPIIVQRKRGKMAILE